MDDLKLANLLCTRLCHDIVGPVGAVNNGLELLEEMAAGVPADILEMLRHSAESTTRRLRFFRAAFGLPTSATTAETLDGVRDLADGMFGHGRIVLAWPQGAPPGALGRPEHGQLLLVMLWCAAEALPRGGRIDIAFAGGDGGPRITAAGHPVAFDDAARRMLAGTPADDGLDPRRLAPYLAWRLATAAGRRLVLDESIADRAVLAAEPG